MAGSGGIHVIQRELDEIRSAAKDLRVGVHHLALDDERQRQEYMLERLEDLQAMSKLRHDYSGAIQDNMNDLKDTIQLNADVLRYLESISKLERPITELAYELTHAAVDSSQARETPATVFANKDLTESISNCWEYITQLTALAQVHLKAAASHQKFHHGMNETTAHLEKNIAISEQNMRFYNPLGQVEEALTLTKELQDRFSVFSKLWEDSRTLTVKARSLVAIDQRLGTVKAGKAFGSKQQHGVMVKALINLTGADFQIREGEEMLLVDNTDHNHWKVQTTQGIRDLPSIALLTLGSSPEKVFQANSLQNSIVTGWKRSLERSCGKLVRYYTTLFENFGQEEAVYFGNQSLMDTFLDDVDNLLLRPNYDTGILQNAFDRFVQALVLSPRNIRPPRNSAAFRDSDIVHLSKPLVRLREHLAYVDRVSSQLSMNAEEVNRYLREIEKERQRIYSDISTMEREQKQQEQQLQNLSKKMQNWQKNRSVMDRTLQEYIATIGGSAGSDISDTSGSTTISPSDLLKSYPGTPLQRLREINRMENEYIPQPPTKLGRPKLAASEEQATTAVAVGVAPSAKKQVYFSAGVHQAHFVVASCQTQVNYGEISQQSVVTHPDCKSSRDTSTLIKTIQHEAKVQVATHTSMKPSASTNDLQTMIRQNTVNVATQSDEILRRSRTRLGEVESSFDLLNQLQQMSGRRAKSSERDNVLRKSYPGLFTTRFRTRDVESQISKITTERSSQVGVRISFKDINLSRVELENLMIEVTRENAKALGLKVGTILCPIGVSQTMDLHQGSGVEVLGFNDVCSLDVRNRNMVITATTNQQTSRNAIENFHLDEKVASEACDRTGEVQTQIGTFSKTVSVQAVASMQVMEVPSACKSLENVATGNVTATTSKLRVIPDSIVELQVDPLTSPNSSELMTQIGCLLHSRGIHSDLRRYLTDFATKTPNMLDLSTQVGVLRSREDDVQSSLTTETTDTQCQIGILSSTAGMQTHQHGGQRNVTSLDQCRGLPKQLIGSAYNAQVPQTSDATTLIGRKVCDSGTQVSSKLIPMEVTLSKIKVESAQVSFREKAHKKVMQLPMDSIICPAKMKFSTELFEGTDFAIADYNNIGNFLLSDDDTLFRHSMVPDTEIVNTEELQTQVGVLSNNKTMQAAIILKKADFSGTQMGQLTSTMTTTLSKEPRFKLVPMSFESTNNKAYMQCVAASCCGRPIDLQTQVEHILTPQQSHSFMSKDSNEQTFPTISSTKSVQFHQKTQDLQSQIGNVSERAAKATEEFGALQIESSPIVHETWDTRANLMRKHISSVENPCARGLKETSVQVGTELIATSISVSRYALQNIQLQFEEDAKGQEGNCQTNLASLICPSKMQISTRLKDEATGIKLVPISQTSTASLSFHEKANVSIASSKQNTAEIPSFLVTAENEVESCLVFDAQTMIGSVLDLQTQVGNQVNSLCPMEGKSMPLETSTAQAGTTTNVMEISSKPRLRVQITSIPNPVADSEVSQGEHAILDYPQTVDRIEAAQNKVLSRNVASQVGVRMVPISVEIAKVHVKNLDINLSQSKTSMQVAGFLCPANIKLNSEIYDGSGLVIDTMHKIDSVKLVDESTGKDSSHLTTSIERQPLIPASAEYSTSRRGLMSAWWSGVARQKTEKRKDKAENVKEKLTEETVIQHPHMSLGCTTYSSLTEPTDCDLVLEASAVVQYDQACSQMLQTQLADAEVNQFLHVRSLDGGSIPRNNNISARINEKSQICLTSIQRVSTESKSVQVGIRLIPLAVDAAKTPLSSSQIDTKRQLAPILSQIEAKTRFEPADISLYVDLCEEAGVQVMQMHGIRATSEHIGEKQLILGAVESHLSQPIIVKGDTQYVMQSPNIDRVIQMSDRHSQATVPNREEMASANTAMNEKAIASLEHAAYKLGSIAMVNSTPHAKNSQLDLDSSSGDTGIKASVTAFEKQISQADTSITTPQTISSAQQFSTLNPERKTISVQVGLKLTPQSVEVQRIEIENMDLEMPVSGLETTSQTCAVHALLCSAGIQLEPTLTESTGVTVVSLKDVQSLSLQHGQKYYKASVDSDKKNVVAFSDLSSPEGVPLTLRNINARSGITFCSDSQELSYPQKKRENLNQVTRLRVRHEEYSAGEIRPKIIKTSRTDSKMQDAKIQVGAVLVPTQINLEKVRLDSTQLTSSQKEKTANNLALSNDSCLYTTSMQLSTILTETPGIRVMEMKNMSDIGIKYENTACVADLISEQGNSSIQKCLRLRPGSSIQCSYAPSANWISNSRQPNLQTNIDCSHSEQNRALSTVQNKEQKTFLEAQVQVATVLIPTKVCMDRIGVDNLEIEFPQSNDLQSNDLNVSAILCSSNVEMTPVLTCGTGIQVVEMTDLEHIGIQVKDTVYLADVSSTKVKRNIKSFEFHSKNLISTSIPEEPDVRLSNFSSFRQNQFQKIEKVLAETKLNSDLKLRTKQFTATPDNKLLLTTYSTQPQIRADTTMQEMSVPLISSSASRPQSIAVACQVGTVIVPTQLNIQNVDLVGAQLAIASADQTQELGVPIGSVICPANLEFKTMLTSAPGIQMVELSENREIELQYGAGNAPIIGKIDMNKESFQQANAAVHKSVAYRREFASRPINTKSQSEMSPGTVMADNWTICAPAAVVLSVENASTRQITGNTFTEDESKLPVGIESVETLRRMLQDTRCAKSLRITTNTTTIGRKASSASLAFARIQRSVKELASKIGVGTTQQTVSTGRRDFVEASTPSSRRLQSLLSRTAGGDDACELATGQFYPAPFSTGRVSSSGAVLCESTVQVGTVLIPTRVRMEKVELEDAQLHLRNESNRRTDDYNVPMDSLLLQSAVEMTAVLTEESGIQLATLSDVSHIAVQMDDELAIGAISSASTRRLGSSAGRSITLEPGTFSTKGVSKVMYQVTLNEGLQVESFSAIDRENVSKCNSVGNGVHRNLASTLVSVQANIPISAASDQSLSCVCGRVLTLNNQQREFGTSISGNKQQYCVTCKAAFSPESLNKRFSANVSCIPKEVAVQCSSTAWNSNDLEETVILMESVMEREMRPLVQTTIGSVEYSRSAEDFSRELGKRAECSTQCSVATRDAILAPKLPSGVIGNWRRIDRSLDNEMITSRAPPVYEVGQSTTTGRKRDFNFYSKHTTIDRSAGVSSAKTVARQTTIYGNRTPISGSTTPTGLMRPRSLNDLSQLPETSEVTLVSATSTPRIPHTISQQQIPMASMRLRTISLCSRCVCQVETHGSSLQIAFSDRMGGQIVSSNYQTRRGSQLTSEQISNRKFLEASIGERTDAVTSCTQALRRPGLQCVSCNCSLGLITIGKSSEVPSRTLLLEDMSHVNAKATVSRIKEANIKCASCDCQINFAEGYFIAKGAEIEGLNIAYLRDERLQESTSANRQLQCSFCRSNYQKDHAATTMVTPCLEASEFKTNESGIYCSSCTCWSPRQEKRISSNLPSVPFSTSSANDDVFQLATIVANGRQEMIPNSEMYSRLKDHRIVKDIISSYDDAKRRNYISTTTQTEAIADSSGRMSTDKPWMTRRKPPKRHDPLSSSISSVSSDDDAMSFISTPLGSQHVIRKCDVACSAQILPTAFDKKIQVTQIVLPDH